LGDEPASPFQRTCGPRTTDRGPRTKDQRLRFYIAALVVLAALSRLPQLLSPNLLLDGDECTLGLMAKHVAQFKALPIFFYGQHYGFSTIEAGVGAVGIALFGTGPIQLKVAMLALWIVGIVFLFLAASTFVGRPRAFWIGVVLLLTPAWAVWSMKARGGYLTAFVASSAIAWILVQDRERDSIARWIAAGILTSIVYLAQPLWLPGVIVIATCVLVARRRFLRAIGFLAIPIATALIVRTHGGPPLGNPSPFGELPLVADQIYVNLTGAYYLRWALEPPGAFTKALAIVWCALLAATVVAQARRVMTRRFSLWSHAFFLAIVSTIVAEWLSLRARDARYLLPIGAYLVLLAGIEVVDLVDRRLLSKRLVSTLTAVMITASAVSMIEFTRFSFLWKNAPHSLSETRRLRRVLNYLHGRDVKHVFSMNGLLEWQLMFYSDETITARYGMMTDRYPAYVDAVDRALAEGQPIAVVGYANTSGAPGCWDVPVCTGGIEAIVPNPDDIFIVDDKYFVYTGADAELLHKLRFRLPE